MATGFENLRVYKFAQDLELKIHELTKNFPTDEKFKMIDQMRRASASVVNNIAEGYGKYNFGEKLLSFQIARGEAYEVRSQIISAKGKEYIEIVIANNLELAYTDLIKGISSYINFIRKQRGIF